MTDIKELALRVGNAQFGPTAGFIGEDDIIELCTRFLAAYLAEQEPVAWSYCPECGSEEIHHETGRHKQCANCHQEWFSDIDYSDVVQSNLSKLFTAPPEPIKADPNCTCDEHGACAYCWQGKRHDNEPAPQQQIQDSSNGSLDPSAVCAAPSSEEVREIVGRLRVWYREGGSFTARGAADLIERLAARVPDGCVVVPREPTEAMLNDGANALYDAVGHRGLACYKAMIAAGEVK